MNPSLALFFAVVLCVTPITIGGDAVVAPRAIEGAATVHVERQGQRIPATTAREAVESAQPGDVIVLGPQIHRGPLVIAVDRVTLRGLPGAVVNGNSSTWQPEWRREPSIAEFAYSAAIPFEPAVMSIDGRNMIRLEASRGGLVVHRDGVGRAGRNALRAAFTYQSKDRRVVVSFAEDVNPSSASIEAAPDDSAAVAIRGADGVAIEGLIVTGGMNGILLTETTGSEVRNCLVYAADAGIKLYRGATGCRVLRNDVTWNPDALTIDNDRDSGLAADDVWMAHKRFGTYDKWGILIDQAGHDNEVAYNYVYNVFNGIQNENGVGKADVQAHFTKHVLANNAPYNRGMKVHHNRVDLALDDALEPGNELVDAEWYGNIVTRSRCAVRFKTVTMGPFYFHDNVLLDCFDGLRLYKSSPTSAEVFIYNNVVRHPAAIVYHDMDSVMWNDPWLGKQIARGTPGFHFFNNLFLSESQFANNGSEVRPNFKSDFNVLTAPPEPALVLRGIDEHSRFHVPADQITMQGPLPQIAPSVLAGRRTIDLSRIGVTGTPPGWDAAASASTAGPQATSLQETPRGPTSGLWEKASEGVSLEERDNTLYHLTPQRWVQGTDLHLKLLDLVPGAPIDLHVTGASLSERSEYTLQLIDPSGEVLQEIKRTSAGDRADEALTSVVPTSDVLDLRIRSKGEPQWLATITRGEGMVGFDGAELHPIRKYDGGSYAVIYRIAEADRAAESFIVNARQRNDGAYAVEVTRPDGTKSPLAADGVVPIRGETGEYRIEIAFTKKADLGVTGPSTLLRFDPTQDTPRLRRQWGRPGF